MICPRCIYVFCIYLRTNSDLCHLHHKLIGFYNRDEKCLQRGTNWVFQKSSLPFVFKGLNLPQVYLHILSFRWTGTSDRLLYTRLRILGRKSRDLLTSSAPICLSRRTLCYKICSFFMFMNDTFLLVSVPKQILQRWRGTTVEERDTDL